MFLVTYKTKINKTWVAAIAPWFCLSLPSGSNPKHTIYTFFNLYWNCNEKRTKINKKRPGLTHFLKKLNKTYSDSSPIQPCTKHCTFTNVENSNRICLRKCRTKTRAQNSLNRHHLPLKENHDCHDFWPDNDILPSNNTFLLNTLHLLISVARFLN